MIGAMAGITAAAALLRPHDTFVFFGQVLPALSKGTAFYANQSLAGVMFRIFSSNPYTTPWLALSWEFLLAAAGGMVLIAFWFWRTRHEPALARAMAFIPLLPLLSSVTWPHHLVILLPVIWVVAIALAERDWPLSPTVGTAGLLRIVRVVAGRTVAPPLRGVGVRPPPRGAAHWLSPPHPVL